MSFYVQSMLGILPSPLLSGLCSSLRGGTSVEIGSNFYCVLTVTLDRCLSHSVTQVLVLSAGDDISAFAQDCCEGNELVQVHT